MFEGKLLSSAPVPWSANDPDSLLRELSWPDLRARLAAAHDFRCSLYREAAASDASFDAGSARWLAAHEPLPLGEDGVNREVSANLKWAAGKNAPAMQRGAHVHPASRGSE